MFILDYDLIPEADRTGLYFTTWREQSGARSNVIRKVDGVREVWWPNRVDGVMVPEWAYELVE